MRLRTFGAAAGALVAATAFTVAAPGVAVAAEKHAIAACSYRVCVALLDLKRDRDGDGYADVDEQAAGTNPTDPKSYPGALKLIDLFNRSALPSFANGFTEVVVLPQATPDGRSLATGLGRFDLVKGLPSVAGSTQEFLDTLNSNGFGALGDIEAFFNTLMPKNQSDLPWNGATGTAWYSDGDGGTTGYGPKVSSGKDATSTSYSGGTMTTVYGGTGGYSESKTAVSTWNDSATGSPHYHAETNTTEHDAMARTTKETTTTESGQRDTKTGESTKVTTVITTTYDPDTGEKTGSTETRTTTEVKDEQKTTTTVTVTRDGDGNVTDSSTDVKKEDCPNNKCGEGMVDPDYVDTSGPITGAQVAQVIAKLNAVKTPGPDNGDVITGTKPPTLTDRWAPYMLFADDGVVVLGNAGVPRTTIAPVDYDPHLQELAGLGGTKPPRQNPDGSTSWSDGNGTYYPR